MSTLNSFGTKTELRVSKKNIQIYSLPALEKRGFSNVSRLPYSIKILLENLLRREDNAFVKSNDINSLAEWDATGLVAKEISFMPARVLLQDFTGVPAVVDLAAMRDAMVHLKGKAEQINPKSAVDLVIDHSVMVDSFGNPGSFRLTLNVNLNVMPNVMPF